MTLPTEQPQLIGYPITLKKFILFNVLTLGIFEIVWAFKHFRALKGRGKAKTAAAVVFSVFLPLSFFDMMKEYESSSSQTNFPIKFNKFLLGLSYFFIELSINFADRFPGLPDWYALAAFPFSLIPLMLMQRQVNLLNKTLYPDVPFAPPMTWRHWVGLAIGVIVLIVMLVAALLLGDKGST
ncbi:MAG: hypothetical protein WCT03_09720 [Candidatus Obscuribacterales bacterium]